MIKNPPRTWILRRLFRQNDRQAEIWVSETTFFFTITFLLRVMNRIYFLSWYFFFIICSCREQVPALKYVTFDVSWFYPESVLKSRITTCTVWESLSVSPRKISIIKENKPVSSRIDLQQFSNKLCQQKAARSLHFRHYRFIVWI